MNSNQLTRACTRGKQCGTVYHVAQPSPVPLDVVRRTLTVKTHRLPLSSNTGRPTVGLGWRLARTCVPGSCV